MGKDLSGNIISIIGGSGSGKDTQAGMLAKHYNLPHSSMGEIFRSEGEKGNPLVDEAMEIIAKGNWVPDRITTGVLTGYVKENTPGGFIITGYPRPPEQCESLAKLAEEMSLKVFAVIHIEVPDGILLERMRAQAAESPDREDTSEAAMKKRLENYHNTITPILEYYSNNGQLVSVDGTPAVEEVFSSIVESLDSQ